jgi:uncharacterized membrane protein
MGGMEEGSGGTPPAVGAHASIRTIRREEVRVIFLLSLFQLAVLIIISVVIGMVLVILAGIVWIFIQGSKTGRGVIGRHQRFLNSRHS